MMNEQTQRKGLRLVIIGLAAVAGIDTIAWLNLTAGPGLTTDSYHYLAAANSLFDNGTLRMSGGEPMIVWPPLFPFLLHLLRYISPFPLLQSAGIFQAATFGGVILMTGVLLHRLVRRTAVLAGGLVATVTAAPLLFVHHFLYSEPLFVLLMLLQIWVLSKYALAPDWKIWALVVLITALLPLQRYIGVALIAAAMLVIWYVHRESRLLLRLLRTIGCGLLSLLPLLLWWLRNLSLTGSATGERAISRDNIFGHAWRSLDVLSVWVMPLPLPIIFRISGTIVLMAGVTALIYKRWNLFSPALRKTVGITAAVFLIYCAFLLATKSRMGEGLNERFLMPVYIPFLLLCCLALDQAIALFPKIGRWLLLAFALWLAYPIVRGAKNVAQWSEHTSRKA
jgi:hypothetical protein